MKAILASLISFLLGAVLFIFGMANINQGAFWVAAMGLFCVLPISLIMLGGSIIANLSGIADWLYFNFGSGKDRSTPTARAKKGQTYQ